MPCSRGDCIGVPICNATDICCIAFQQDCGEGCDGLATGFSRVQITANGEIEICSNVGGVCGCTVIGASLEDTFVDNGDGTVTHTSNQGTPSTVDICNDILPFCTVENMGNVAAGATDGQVLVWDNATQMWTPASAVLPTQEDTWVNNNNGTITHTGNEGTVSTIDICNNVLPFCNVENMGNVAPGAVDGDIFIWDNAAQMWTPTALIEDTWQDNNDGTVTHTSIFNTPILIDFCDVIADCPTVFVDADFTGALNIPPGVFTKVTFDTENTDLQGDYNPGTGIFTAPTDGLYMVCNYLQFDFEDWNLPNATAFTSIFINGVFTDRLNVARTQSVPGVVNEFRAAGAGCKHVELTAGDTVELFVIHSDNINHNLLAQPGTNYFNISRVHEI